MAVGSASSSTHSLTTLGPAYHRPAPLDTSKFTTESPRPTPRDLYSLFPPNQGLTDDDVLLTIRPLWKRRLHQLLEQPASSGAAFAVHMVSTALIVTSALITVLETVPTFHYGGVCCEGSFYGIIDLLSVLPYYIELMLGQDTSVLFRFSILRMFRLLRVFRPFRHNHTILLTIEVMYLSVRRSQHALLAIGFFVVMILTVFSTLLYFAERGTWDEVMDTFINSDGDPTQFASIPAAAWFVILSRRTSDDPPALPPSSPILVDTGMLADSGSPSSDNDGGLRRNHTALIPRAAHHTPHSRVRTVAHHVAEFCAGAGV
ncbi:hypothetical protein D9611_014291 [Ephemerocybe angulata]|uniref:Ion transport domain-containing protein n=1 Tax=Ephemerocybe angulata TaxID=980116 RepID=A0A8H5BV66_9AGAR|nr:hypothetical protein D9611_014291 [Tulosesus angulatus]